MELCRAFFSHPRPLTQSLSASPSMNTLIWTTDNTKLEHTMLQIKLWEHLLWEARRWRETDLDGIIMGSKKRRSPNWLSVHVKEAAGPGWWGTAILRWLKGLEILVPTSGILWCGWYSVQAAIYARSLFFYIGGVIYVLTLYSLYPE